MDLEQGRITRIHDFNMNFNSLKSRLRELNQKYPTGVIIPLHEKDLDNLGLLKIVEGLNECDYLRKVFIALSATNDNNYEKAKRYSSEFKIPCEIIWCNKPQVDSVLRS